VVSVPALFIRPQPTSYLSSWVRGVPCHGTECRRLLIVALRVRKDIVITAVPYRRRSWFLVYGTGRGCFDTV